MAEVEYFDQKVEAASRDENAILQFQKLKALLKKVIRSIHFTRISLSSLE